MKKKKITLAVIIIVFLLIFLFIKFREFNLTNNGILLNAKTLEWAGSSKMGMDLKYEFYYMGEKKEDANAFPKIWGLHDFEGRYFPVMYDPKLGMSQLLIEPSDFKRFNLPFPDSLKWVLPYFKE